MTCLYRKYMVFPLREQFFIKNFRLKNKVNGSKKSSKFIENKCSHCALRLILIGKDAHPKGNIRHVRSWSQTISCNFSCLFRSKMAKIAKDKCSHCVMDLDYCFLWLSTAQSHRIIALWVHALMMFLLHTRF